MQARIYRIGIIALFLFVVALTAQVPRLVNYQGKITDDSGVALNGDFDITFKIYDGETSVSPIWTEPHTGVSDITITKGLFDVQLGSITTLSLPFDEEYWLELTVEGEPLTPREKLSAVGYAYRAIYADTADYAASFVESDPWWFSAEPNYANLGQAEVIAGDWNNTAFPWAANELVSTVMVEGEDISLLNNDAGYITSADDVDVNQLRSNTAAWLQGDITFLNGSNVTITQSGNNITVNATGGSGSIGGSGTNGRIARFTPDGATIGNSTFRDDGTTVGLNAAQTSANMLYIQDDRAIAAKEGLFVDSYTSNTGTGDIVGLLSKARATTFGDHNGAGIIGMVDGSDMFWAVGVMAVNKNGSTTPVIPSVLTALYADGSNNWAWSGWFTGGHVAISRATSTQTGELHFHDLDGTALANYVGFKAPTALSSNYVYTLPSYPASSGQVLSSTTSGVLSWTDGGGNWTLNGTDIYNNNTGNVGIGTTSPAAKLEVNGDIKLTETTGARTIEVLPSASGVDGGNLILRAASANDDAGSPNSGHLKLYAGSNVDTEGDPGNVYISGGADGAVYIYGSDDSEGPVILAHDGDGNFGNVGIGTPTPTGILQVIGDEVRIGDCVTESPTRATADGDLFVEDALEVEGGIELNGSYITSWPAGGDVTGVTAGDDIDVTSSTGPIPEVSLEDDIDVSIIRAAGAGGLTLYDDGSNLGVFVKDGGNVGIGTTTPASYLSVGGSGNTLYKAYVYQSSTSIGATGIYGSAAQPGGDVANYYAYGVRGYVESGKGNSVGVYGLTAPGSGTTGSGRSAGVKGQSYGSTDGYNYGVYGIIPSGTMGAAIFGQDGNLGSFSGDCGSTSSWAGYFYGDVYISDDLEVDGEMLTSVAYFDGGKSGASPGDRYLDFNNGTEMSATIGYRMPFDGSVTAVSAQFNVSVFTASGPFEIQVRINGSEVFSASMTISSTGNMGMTNSQARGIDTFSAGDVLTLFVDVQPELIASIEKINAFAEVVFDRTSTE